VKVLAQRLGREQVVQVQVQVQEQEQEQEQEQQERVKVMHRQSKF